MIFSFGSVDSRGVQLGSSPIPLCALSFHELFVSISPCQILNIRRSLHLILHLLIAFSNILLCHAFVSSLVLVLLVVHTNQALSISLGDCYPSAKHGQSFSILFPRSWLASILFLMFLLPHVHPFFFHLL